MHRQTLAQMVDGPLFESLEPRLLLDGTPEEQVLQLFSVSPALFVENQGQSADEVPRASTGGAAGEASLQGPAMGSGDDIPVELVGQWGGLVLDAVAVGNYAYVCQGAALAMLDITDPSRPVGVGRILLPAVAHSVAVSGNVAYVADDEAGLEIIDVSNPAAPVWRGQYDTTGYALGVFVSGNLAYVADYDAGLQIIDVSNPAAPVRRGGYDTSGDARGVYVSGSLAYVADSDAGLQIIDVSNPDAPARLGGYDTHSAEDVYVSGNLAYVADGSAGLQIIDVSNP